MFKFVSANTGGVGAKRKLSQRTCDACKKRHKRCIHGQGPTLQVQRKAHVSPTSNQHELWDEKAYEAPTEEPRSSDIDIIQLSLPSPPIQRVSEDKNLRFIGNLSPEASFLATLNGAIRADDQRPEIGVWLGHPRDRTDVDDQPRPRSSVEEQVAPTQLPLPMPCGLQALFPHLQRECMSVLPPDNEFSHMSKVFYSKFNPIFPILYEQDFKRLDHVEVVALKQCICLIAALDPCLKSHLKLPHTESVLSEMEFRSCIATALKSTLYMGVIRDKVVLLQVSALMAFYVDKPSSSEISSFYCVQAVHLAQTLGLHLGWPDEGENLGKSGRIFWCVWALDRLNAATNGRPTLIHDRDMDDRVLRSVSEQIPSFRLFISICRFLDGVISQYRPHPTLDDRPKQPAMPDFEEFVHDADAVEVRSPIMATLELFYLAVLILHNRPQGLTNNDRVPSSDIQSLCATNILSIASEEFKSSMTYWAVLPYAVSLAMSVGYQSLRNSNIAYTRKRAYNIFHRGCDILDDLSKAFRSARMMARLAKDTLHEVERVSVNKTRSHVSEGHGHGVKLSQGDILSKSELQTAHVTTTESRTTLDTSDLAPSDIIAMQVSGTDSLNDATNGTSSTFYHDVNFTNISEIFDSLDGSFDLDRVDTLFSATLNPTMPLMPEEWYNFEPAEQE